MYIYPDNLTLKRVRKKESSLILASQNLEDFDVDGIRELTRPLLAIPPISSFSTPRQRG